MKFRKLVAFIIMAALILPCAGSLSAVATVDYDYTYENGVYTDSYATFELPTGFLAPEYDQATGSLKFSSNGNDSVFYMLSDDPEHINLISEGTQAQFAQLLSEIAASIGYPVSPNIDLFERGDLEGFTSLSVESSVSVPILGTVARQLSFGVIVDDVAVIICYVSMSNNIPQVYRDSLATLDIIRFDYPDTTLYGDVNLDGSVTISDALMLLRASSELITLTPAQQEASDVNFDGFITSVDALIVLRSVLSGEPILPPTAY